MAEYIPVTIADTETDSSDASIPADHAVLSVQLPDAMTGASVAIHGSFDGTTFNPVYLDGSAVSITFGADQLHTINPRATVGMLAVKLVSASAEAADRVFTVAVGKVV